MDRQVIYDGKRLYNLILIRWRDLETSVQNEVVERGSVTKSQTGKKAYV